MDTELEDALKSTGFDPLMIEAEVKVTVYAIDDRAVVTGVHFGILDRISIVRRLLRAGTMHGDVPKEALIVALDIGEKTVEVPFDRIQIEAVE